MIINAKVEFERVVQALAASTKTLKERLRQDTGYLQWIKESDVPDEHRNELRWIKEAVADENLKGHQEQSLISRIVTLSYQLPDSN
jgi:hypothetical protein